MPVKAPDAEALTAELLVCGESECENQLCIAEPGQTTTGKPKFCYHTRYYHTPVCLECGSKTRLKPLLSHPYGIPPGVVNNLKSQTATHFVTGGTVYTTPPRYTTPGDKIPKPKILSPGVWYTLSYVHGSESLFLSLCLGISVNNEQMPGTWYQYNEVHQVIPVSGTSLLPVCLMSFVTRVTHSGASAMLALRLVGHPSQHRYSYTSSFELDSCVSTQTSPLQWCSCETLRHEGQEERVKQCW